MALSPEIQAAIEKGLEQITDIKVLQEALKVLDPNGQLQAQQEEDTPNVSDELKEEPVSDTPAEQGEDIKVDQAQSEKDTPEETQQEPASDISDEQSKEAAAVEQSKDVQPEEADTISPEDKEAKLEPNTDAPEEINDQTDEQLDNSSEQVEDNKNSTSSATQSDNDESDSGSELFDLVDSELSSAASDNDKPKKEKKPSKLGKAVRSAGRKVGNAVKSAGRGIAKAGKATASAFNKVGNYAKNKLDATNNWLRNSILKNVDPHGIDVKKLGEALDAAKLGKYQFGESAEFDKVVIEFQAAIARDDYALVESTMQLVNEMKEYQLLEKDQSYAFLKDYFAQIDEDYQGLINGK